MCMVGASPVVFTPTGQLIPNQVELQLPDNATSNNIRTNSNTQQVFGFATLSRCRKNCRERPALNTRV